MIRPHSKVSAFVALLLLLPVPALAVFVAMGFESTRGTPLGQWVYAAAKLWILLLPAVWHLLIDRSRPSRSPMKQGGAVFGLLSGLVIALAIVGAYFAFGHLVNVDEMRDAATRNGIGTPARYLLLVIPLALVNSLLEEFVWRWFVFRKCESLMNSTIAIVFSSLCFGLHHVVALRAQAGWDVTLLATLGVFLGGCAWCWCYRRYNSIWPGYISHIVADIAVFGVGYVILFGWPW